MATSHAPAATLERAIKGAGLLKTPGAVVHLGGVRYRVQASHGECWYLVNLAECTCTCADHRRRGALCKHLHAARQAAEPARIRVMVENGAVTGWHYADADVAEAAGVADAAEAKRQAAAETAKRIADELWPQ